jgi:hypothetical protein
MIRYPPSGASLMAATTPPESGAPVQFRPLSRLIWYAGALGGRGPPLALHHDAQLIGILRHGLA